MLVKINAIFVILAAVSSIALSMSSYPDYSIHKCKRDCNAKYEPLTCEYNFTVEWQNTMKSLDCKNCPYNLTDCYARDCISANGISRAVVLVNKMMPGPAIEVCMGDTIVVNVINKLRGHETTAIHWHGVRMKYTPYMDGVSLVTQCPILYNNRFQYKFIAEEPGTMWWHSHLGQQRIDGLFGALIVRHNNSIVDTKSLYDYDLSEHTMFVYDWLDEDSLIEYSPHHIELGAKKPSTILVNGRGVHTVFLNKSTNQTFVTPRSVFYVEKGFRYRFRVISNGALICPIKFSIDLHNLTIIASDNHYVEPVVVDSFIIYPGERFDFVLNANMNNDYFLIKAKGIADCVAKSSFETAILSYTKNLDQSKIDDWKYLNYTLVGRNGTVLNPYNRKVTDENKNKYIQISQLNSTKNKINDEYYGFLNKPVDKRFYLGMDFHKIYNPEFPQEYFTALFNEINNMMPQMPVLYDWDKIPKEIICNDNTRDKVCDKNNATLCFCIYVFEVDLNDVVEVFIYDKAFIFKTNHNVHLHGYSFAVVAMDKVADVLTKEDLIDLDSKGLISRNLQNPPIKDTVDVPSGGYTIIRFHADNPGTWMFHCHIEFHLEMGMSVFFKVGQSTDLPKKPLNLPTCYPYDTIKDGTTNNKSNMLTQSFVLFSLLFSLCITLYT